jgi:ubiquinone/menaquinone biosynthesis C-methylase UbiE
MAVSEPPQHTISFGPHVANDAELRLVGDVKGKRVLELGLPYGHANSVAMAQSGARAMAIDNSSERIALARRTAETAEVRVEFHQAELADMGFVTSSSLDLVLCIDKLNSVDDIDRLLRQVHRVLKSEASFVAVVEHPAAAMFDNDDAVARRRYGADGALTIGELCMSLQRSNFALDLLYELMPLNAPRAIVPTTLAIRARKLGS